METSLTQDILDDLTDSTGVPPISWTPIRASSDCLRTSSSPAARQPLLRERPAAGIHRSAAGSTAPTRIFDLSLSDGQFNCSAVGMAFLADSILARSDNAAAHLATQTEGSTNAKQGQGARDAGWLLLNCWHLVALIKEGLTRDVRA
jgi:hypothetical protein